MTNFEEACKMSAEKWAASFPDEVEAHKFSQKHIDAINEIIYPKPAVKVKKLSKKTVRFIIIAAVLLALATTAIASPAFRQFTLKDFSNHSEYRVGNIKNVPALTDLKVNYIPKGFKKTYSYKKYSYGYTNANKYIYVDKLSLDTEIAFDNETSKTENITIKGAKVIYYITDNNVGTIIYNDGNYIYNIHGNISKEELVKIAQNAEWWIGQNAKFPIFFKFLVTKWPFLKIVYNESLNWKGGVIMPTQSIRVKQIFAILFSVVIERRNNYYENSFK